MRFRNHAFALMLGLLPAMVATAGRAQNEDEIVLGATCAVTGQLAATGLTVFHALEMAVEDVNAAGGVNGKKLRLVNEDAGSSNSSAVTAYIKLVQQHKIPFAFISSYSPQIIAQSTEIARVGIGAMHAGGATDIEALNNSYLFRIKPPDQVNTKAVASVALDDLKKKKPGLIYVQNDYGQGFARGLEEIFAARGIAMIKESYGPGDNDMSAQLQSLVNQGADVLLTAGFNRDSALVLRARKALGITLPVVGQQALGVSATTDLLEADELTGIYALVDAVLDERKAYDKTDFLRRYEERYKLKPDPSFITNYYDGVWMVADAIKQVGEDPKKVRDFIAGLKDYNALTRAYTTDAKGNMTNDVVIVRYAENKVQIPVRMFSALSGAAAPGPDQSASDDTTPAAPTAAPSAIKAAMQTMFNGIAIGCIYALLALGFVLVYEATGVVNFANGQFVVIGAFLGISGIAALGATVPGTMLALAAMIGLGILFFFVVYRPLQTSPVVTVIVGTIAVGIIVQNIGLLIWGPLPQRLPSPFGVTPISVSGIVVSAHIVAVIAITALVVAGLYLLLYRTVIGARMRAVAQDAEAAKLMGINVAGIYALTWALAGGLAGLGGLLMGPVWFVDASMGDALALKSFAATIIGGFGSVPGAVLGGLIVGLAESLGAAYISSTYKDALVFLLMVGFLIARPQGLFGEARGDRG
ncbi:MAG: ABC transporter substrate-binding protein [Rhodospirillaceae bacterium]|nr:ABC transporter substrate-binding protein [Rhodospirillaceae bacterium]